MAHLEFISRPRAWRAVSFPRRMTPDLDSSHLRRRGAPASPRATPPSGLRGPRGPPPAAVTSFFPFNVQPDSPNRILLSFENMSSNLLTQTPAAAATKPPPLSFLLLGQKPAAFVAKALKACARHLHVLRVTTELATGENSAPAVGTAPSCPVSLCATCSVPFATSPGFCPAPGARCPRAS